MKKKRAKVLIIIAAVAVVIIIGAIINFYPLFFMRTLATGPIPGTDIFAVKSSICDMYLVKTADGYIAIDAGSNLGVVQKGLKQLEIDPADIAYVLLTHSDYDHVAALELFPNALICLSEDELPLVDGSAKRSNSSGNVLPAGIETAELRLLGNAQELFLGEDTIRCFKAPGHTLGSMMYLLNDVYLFSGDALMISGDVVKPHPFTMDTELARQSIGLIEGMPNENLYIFTAHYGSHTAKDLHR
jgi:glyoxylase-like metal-dependent hydrolase (beta-lactamase superfamily II)